MYKTPSASFWLAQETTRIHPSHFRGYWKLCSKASKTQVRGRGSIKFDNQEKWLNDNWMNEPSVSTRSTNFISSAHNFLPLRQERNMNGRRRVIHPLPFVIQGEGREFINCEDLKLKIQKESSTGKRKERSFGDKGHRQVLYDEVNCKDISNSSKRLTETKLPNET